MAKKHKVSSNTKFAIIAIGVIVIIAGAFLVFQPGSTTADFLKARLDIKPIDPTKIVQPYGLVGTKKQIDVKSSSIIIPDYGTYTCDGGWNPIGIIDDNNVKNLPPSYSAQGTDDPELFVVCDTGGEDPGDPGDDGGDTVPSECNTHLQLIPETISITDEESLKVNADYFNSCGVNADKLVLDENNVVMCIAEATGSLLSSCSFYAPAMEGVQTYKINYVGSDTLTVQIPTLVQPEISVSPSYATDEVVVMVTNSANYGSDIVFALLRCEGEQCVPAIIKPYQSSIEFRDASVREPKTYRYVVTAWNQFTDQTKTSLGHIVTYDDYCDTSNFRLDVLPSGFDLSSDHKTYVDNPVTIIASGWGEGCAGDIVYTVGTPGICNFGPEDGATIEDTTIYPGEKFKACTFYPDTVAENQNIGIKLEKIGSYTPMATKETKLDVRLQRKKSDGEFENCGAIYYTPYDPWCMNSYWDEVEDCGSILPGGCENYPRQTCCNFAWYGSGVGELIEEDNSLYTNEDLILCAWAPALTNCRSVDKYEYGGTLISSESGLAPYLYGIGFMPDVVENTYSFACGSVPYDGNNGISNSCIGYPLKEDYSIGITTPPSIS